MEQKKKEIAVAPAGSVQVGSSPAEMVQILIKQGIKPEDLEKMLTLQERWEATQANKSYCREMAVVQGNIPIVVKTLKNNQTGSMYAGLGAIINETKKIYTERGFSVSFYEGDSPLPEHIRIYADIRHAEGHKETSHYDMPMDGKGIRGNANMTPIHGKSSSTSYGRRILMCMIWNIPTGDDDGNAAGTQVELIDDKQLSTIRDFVDNKDVNIEKFLKYMGIESVEDMPKSEYNKAIKGLEAKK